MDLTRNTLDQQLQSLVQAGDQQVQRITDYEICVKTEAEDKFWRMVELWSLDPDPKEWAALGVGRIQDLEDDGREFTIVFIDEFIELPAYNIQRRHSIRYRLDDVTKIASNSIPLIMAHSHTEEEPEFSPQDIAQAIVIDIALGRPLIHVVVTPNHRMELLHLGQCWRCPHCPFPRPSTVENDWR